MTPRPVLDLARLPHYAFGHAATMWWGTLGFIAIEATAFALGIGVYLYLVFINDGWPLSALPPNPVPGTIVLVLLLASLLPNAWVIRAARAEDLRKVRIGLVAMALFGIAPSVVRIWEFPALGVQWDDNAYGSILWLLLGLHTTHLLTDLGDSLVLMVLMFTHHAHGKRFSDVEDNGVYWYFVVAAWVPIWLLLYIVPRL